MCMICKLQDQMLKLALRTAKLQQKNDDLPEAVQRRLQASALLITAAARIIDGISDDRADLMATLAVNQANSILHHTEGCHITNQQKPESAPN